jgi:hypothetical protein
MSLIERQLALFVEFVGVEDYESAYHALMAALHRSEHVADLESIDYIVAAIGRLERAIEAARPQHPLSRSQAERRGQQPLCASLRTHVDAVLLRLRSAQQRSNRPSAAPT